MRSSRVPVHLLLASTLILAAAPARAADDPATKALDVRTVTVDGISLTTVPGLPRLGKPDGSVEQPRNPGPAPTRSQCESAWRAHAPRATLRWMSGYAARPALVSVASARGWWFCSVQVAIAKDRLFQASLYRPNGAFVWKGIVLSPLSRNDLDAVVARDGTIRVR
jgi:hypothetical protein